MKPGAMVLLTFKNTFHKKAVWEIIHLRMALESFTYSFFSCRRSL